MTIQFSRPGQGGHDGDTSVIDKKQLQSQKKQVQYYLSSLQEEQGIAGCKIRYISNFFNKSSVASSWTAPIIQNHDCWQSYLCTLVPKWR